MGLFCILSYQALGNLNLRGSYYPLAAVCILPLSSAAIYFALLHLLKFEELKFLFAALGRVLPKRNN